MIRLALAFLGMSVGAAGAQGLVRASAALETCGGTQAVLQAVSDLDGADLEAAAGVVSARLEASFGTGFDYADVDDGTIVVSLPGVMDIHADRLTPAFEQIGFGFHAVVEQGASTKVQPTADQRLVPDAELDDLHWLVDAAPIVTADHLIRAGTMFDYAGQPAVSFKFTPQGRDIFGAFTGANIGETVAIIVRNEVVSAPRILAQIHGSEGMITGAFSIEDAAQLAALLQSGDMPFALDLVGQRSVDGSDPSADFCP